MHEPIWLCKFLGRNLKLNEGQGSRDLWKLNFKTGGKARRRLGCLRGLKIYIREAVRTRLNTMFYGVMVWDPWLIVSQIVCLQCLYYLSLGLFMWILVGSHVPRLTLLYFFDYSMLSASTVTGWCVLAAFFFSALAGAGYMFFLIERAKKCLDFAATLYIIHLFLCLIYGGWPSTVTWWVSNGLGLAAMALLGEWLCRRHELRDIPIRTRTNNRSRTAV